ncbi:uncharacterized protein LOC131679417 [Topomyia yanbarensis]|uniref:uncharacterized protein LOC131679417 n=1 Tax=Topomyia yanbarensis TaxID=2498891 RepID=UPI00273C20F8|nr:uncharacterized protein LOC131679417 [Topomyia yanbarensis]
MEHHGLYTDISNSFPSNGGVLPNTNVKYHHHHLPQIPPQPPPQSNNANGQVGNPQVYLSQQQQQQHQQQTGSYGQQQQKVQSQHVDSDPIGSDLYQDAAGLFDATNALCNSSSGSTYSNNSNNSNVNNSKNVEFTSRKFETNTGDSITYNINNINTNIVNNISGSGLAANGVQGINPGQAAITGGPTTDFLGNTQFATPGGNAQISFNKESDTNPTIINISNNNHNIMAPPYPYPYQAKISGMGALNELNTKFGVNHGWAASAATSHSGVSADFGHENTIISNFEAKNPNKYHTNRTNYRYQQDFVQPPSQQAQTATHYQHNYGLYHPEGAQATSIPQPNGNHGYEPYPHIVRGKYTSLDEANRYGRSHQHHSTGHSQVHHDLVYNDRSRYANSFAGGYGPPTPGYYPTAQPTNKNILNPNVEYFNNGYIKQMQSMGHHAASPYVPTRPTYPHQGTTMHGYHQQGYHLNHQPTYDDPYHHRTRVPTMPHHMNDPHSQQPYANYPNHVGTHAYPPNHKLTFSKTTNDFYTPNIHPHPYNNPLSHPQTPTTVRHTPHYSIKYTSQTIVPPHNQSKPISHSSMPVAGQQPPQKSSNSCYFDTPNPIIDMNHPLVDLEEQINSVKILKTNREGAVGYENSHALNYDCQQKYLMNHYLHSKTTSGPGGGYLPNHPTNPTNYGYTTMEQLGLGPRSFVLDENLKDKNLRDYLSSWNETEEEDTSGGAGGGAAVGIGNAEAKETNNNHPTHLNFESCKYLEEALDQQLPPLYSGVIVANVQNGGPLPDILVDLEKTKEELKTGQETTEVGEKLYILETYDVPHSELNKYKHLNVINELPKNVVPIHDSADSLKFLEEIESNRDKYYQTELESEVVYEERKKDEEKKEGQAVAGKGVKEQQKRVGEPVLKTVEKEAVKNDKPVAEAVVEKDRKITESGEDEAFKVPRYVPKYRKRRHYYHDYPRFPKKARRSSIEEFLYSDVPKPKPVALKKNPKKLLTLCVASLNSRVFRRYAKEDIARRKEAAAVKEMELTRSVECSEQTVGIEELPEEIIEKVSETSNAEVVEKLAAESLELNENILRQESDNSTKRSEESEEIGEIEPKVSETACGQTDEQVLTEAVEMSQQSANEEHTKTSVDEEKVLSDAFESETSESQTTLAEEQVPSPAKTPTLDINEEDPLTAEPEAKDESETSNSSDNNITESIDLTESDVDDDVFEESPAELKNNLENNKVSVIVDEARSSDSSTSADSSSEDDSDSSAEADAEDASAQPKPKPEAQQVSVIQKLESIEYCPADDIEEPTPIFNALSLREIASEAFERYHLLYDYQRVPTLRKLCYEFLLEKNLLPQPESLQSICERFICNNRQLFIIEEIRHQPERLQDICQRVVNETNIIIDVNNLCIYSGEELLEQEKEEQEGRVFIVEDGHGTIADLLRDSEDMEAGMVIIPEEASEEHEIFLGSKNGGESLQVIMESQSFSDSENEIYKKVEQEIEKMMTTSSDEEDEEAKKAPHVVNEEILKHEFFSFVEEDGCIQYEEVIPVNKEAYRRDSLIRDLREKYIVTKGMLLTCRLKLLRKYLCYQRFITTKDQRVLSKRRFFSKRLICLRKKIAAMSRRAEILEDSDSNSSSASSVSSSSSSSNDSSSSSASGRSSATEEMVTETEIMERSCESLSEDASNQSESFVTERLLETNNNQLEAEVETKPAHVESQQPTKEEDSNSNSSDSRSRGCPRRTLNIPQLMKKKKLSFEESLLNIEQMYKKTGSPTPTSESSNSTNSAPATRKRRYSTNCRPNVIVNVNNNREAPKKLIIPAYKIFDQTLAIEGTAAPRTYSRTVSRSSSSSSNSNSNCNNANNKLVNSTQRSSGLIRVNYPNKPSQSSKIAAGGGAGSRACLLPITNGGPCLDRRVPFVRLERIDYVEKLAEKYRKQQQQQQFSKQRQRRKSTFT